MAQNGYRRRVIILGNPQGAAFALQSNGYPTPTEGHLEAGGALGYAAAPRLDGRLIPDGLAELPNLLAQGRREVFLAVAADKYSQVEPVVKRQKPAGAKVRMALYPSVDGARRNGHANGHDHGASWRSRTDSWQYWTLKRAFDVAVSALGIVALSPLMVLIAIAIKLDSPGEVLYRQARVGWRGRVFPMYKFRSMRQDADDQLQALLASNEAQGPMFKLRQDPRVTRVGKVIRRVSLDELPQLFNVLEGTMSLVGPRPPLPREVAEYQPWHFQRLMAVPGVSGLWQVKRVGVSSFSQMMVLDQQYLENWSLVLDLSILLRTGPAALRGQGAY